MKIYVFLLVSFIASVKGDEPIRKYRYESKDVMETAATTVPIRSHRSIQEGYYPQGGGFSGGYSDIEGYGGSSFVGGGGGIGMGGLGGGMSGYQGGINRLGGGGYLGGISSGGFSKGGYIGGGGLQGGYLGGGGLQGGYLGGAGLQSGLGGGRMISGGGLHTGIIGAESGAGFGGGYIGGGAGIGSGINVRSAGLGGGSLGSAGLGGIGLGSGGLGGAGLGSGGLGGAGLGSGGIGSVGLGSGGLGGAGLGGGGFIGGSSGFIGPIHHTHGGELVDKSVYSDQKKNLNDGSFEKSNGQSGVQLNQGQNGFVQDKVGVQSSQGDLGYYNDAKGGKNVVEDGKSYVGGQQFNQEGQNADEKKLQAGHKKGHVVKGFKSSHHKDETGKTEEYYDEAHDEGDNFNFQGQTGKFGEGSQAAFRGGHDDKFFNADERNKQGRYDAAQYLNKNNADQGQYGQNKYVGNGQVYGVNNGIDQQSLLGHHEANRFFKHHPFFH